MLTLHGEVARTIADRIGAELEPEESLRLATERPVDPAAYDQYVKGLALFSRNDPDSCLRAVEHFELAIEIDPDFTSPYAARSLAYSWAHKGQITDLVRERGLSYARQAIERDEELAEAHVAMALVHKREWDWAASEREFRRALELNPNSAFAHAFYAQLLRELGRLDEALREAELAATLDPRDLQKRTMVEWVHFSAHRYDEAIERFRAVLDLEPDYVLAVYNMGLARTLLGR